MAHVIFYVHDLRTSGVVRDTLKLAAYCAAYHRVTLVAGYQDGYLKGEAGGSR